MLLNIQNTNVHFHTKNGLVHVVRDLSYQVNAGETLGIVGESGCGKSVGSMALMGLLPNTAVLKSQGIYFEGKDLTKLKNKELEKIRGKDIGMIFQDPMSSLNPCMRVGEQIDEALMTHTNDSKKRRFQKVVDILDRVGIPDPEKRYFSYPHELSGGMCQRVMIAMAICLKPKLLIADEPTTALDVTIQAQILNLLKDLQKDEGMALILISHDIGVIQYMCEEILVMYAGEVVEKSNSQDLLKAPKHPYTEKLLKSLPKYHGIKKELLDTIPGMVPELSNRPQGCQFAERCAYKTTECGKVQELSEINHSLVRCHTPLNIGASS